jgi:hypothetical protein
VDENTKFINSVFDQLEAERKSGKLAKDIGKNGGYGISLEYPNCISKYNPEGDIVAIGHYKNGGFHATEIFIDEDHEG